MPATLIPVGNDERTKLTDYSLPAIQKAIGGYVYRIILSNGDRMLVNEDGGPLDLPKNERATILAGQHIVGSVVLITGKNNQFPDIILS